MATRQRKQYDVFLCYNSRDRAAVKQFAERLAEWGLSVWFDERRLRPGFSFMDQIDRGLASSSATTVFLGRAGLGRLQREEYQDAFNRYAGKGHPIIPVLLPGCPTRPRLPFGIRPKVWVDFRPNCDYVESFGKLLFGITGSQPNPESLRVIVPEADPLYELTRWDYVSRLRRSGWREITTTLTRRVMAPELGVFHHSLTLAREGHFEDFRWGRVRILPPARGRRIRRVAKVVDARSARWQVAIDPPLRAGQCVTYEGRIYTRNTAALTAEGLMATGRTSLEDCTTGYRGIGALPGLQRFSVTLEVPRQYPVGSLTPFASRQRVRLPEVERHLARHVLVTRTRSSTVMSMTLEPPPRTVRVGLIYQVPRRDDISKALRERMGCD